MWTSRVWKFPNIKPREVSSLGPWSLRRLLGLFLVSNCTCFATHKELNNE